MTDDGHLCAGYFPPKVARKIEEAAKAVKDAAEKPPPKPK
jgi:hypothetical protein